jgi:hypothetical protein
MISSFTEGARLEIRSCHGAVHRAGPGVLAVEQLRDEGVIKGWGLGVNRIEPIDQ